MTNINSSTRLILGKVEDEILFSQTADDDGKCVILISTFRFHRSLRVNSGRITKTRIERERERRIFDFFGFLCRTWRDIKCIICWCQFF